MNVTHINHENTEDRGPRGIILPQWFLGVIAASFLSIGSAGIFAGINTYYTANGAVETNNKQDTRMDKFEDRVQRLETLNANVATLNTKVDNMKEDTVYIRGKLDAILLERGSSK